MKLFWIRRPYTLALCGMALPVTLLMMTSCSGTSVNSNTTSSTTSTTTNAYATAYKSVSWGAGVTVSFPSSCSMTLTTTGVPPSHDAYYLAPAAAGQTVVAYTPLTKMGMAVMAYSSAGIAGSTMTFDICPAKATSITATTNGAIGYMSSGESLFDPYEATGLNPALADNVSYTFTSGGASYTASFIDECNSHSANGSSGAMWHYHGVPVCLTATVDGATGPSHIIGIALDGFPIYGGRDINGNVIPASSLDACNGITSATPEFPSGAYHYVLPIGVTTAQSSLTCFSGTVSKTQIATARRLMCRRTPSA
jgi:hypothetical protein